MRNGAMLVKWECLNCSKTGTVDLPEDDTKGLAKSLSSLYDNHLKETGCAGGFLLSY